MNHRPVSFAFQHCEVRTYILFISFTRHEYYSLFISDEKWGTNRYIVLFATCQKHTHKHTFASKSRKINERKLPQHAKAYNNIEWEALRGGVRRIHIFVRFEIEEPTLFNICVHFVGQFKNNLY